MRTSLQIEEDPEFQRREWRTQRLGWWLLTAFVAAGIAGLFGGGPLSAAAASSDDRALTIQYERFIRSGAPTRFVIELHGASAGHPIELRLNRSWADSVRIERIIPDPAAIRVDADHVVLAFDASANPPDAVLIDWEPHEAGRLRTSVRVDSGAPVTLWQLVYF